MRRKAGFTLLEVLLVVAIVIVIAGILLPRLNPGDPSKEARAISDFRILQAAIESYVKTTNSVPADESQVGSDLENANPQIIGDYGAFRDNFSTTTPFSAYRYFAAHNLANGRKYYVFLSVGRNGSTSVTGISTAGIVQGSVGDDIIATNGKKS